MRQNALKQRQNWTGVALMLCMAMVATLSPAQDNFFSLYNATTAQKFKIRGMTVEFYAKGETQDSLQPMARQPDYRERYFYDPKGRVERYEAYNPNIKVQGSIGPQLICRYEYNENGRMSHRHDTTVFGRSGEWHYQKDSTGRPTVDQLLIPDQEGVAAQRTYYYDQKRRLDKVKYVHGDPKNTTNATCSWKFYVHDAQSFNATSLSPMEMARCQCNLEYLDDLGRHVREIAYDSTGIGETTLFTYDRTGKPIKLEVMDKQSSKLMAQVDIVYLPNGLVKLLISAPKDLSNVTVFRLATSGRQFVIENWANWRLLKEMRVYFGAQELSRYVFSYDLRS